jgi:hypothetical protein
MNVINERDNTTRTTYQSGGAVHRNVVVVAAVGVNGVVVVSADVDFSDKDIVVVVVVGGSSRQ